MNGYSNCNYFMWGLRNYIVVLLQPDDVFGIKSEPCGNLLQIKALV